MDWKSVFYINFGAVFENLVAQELYAHGFAQNHDLFYFNSKKQGELDFVVEQHGEVLPIEVKSGKDYERHRALSNVMTNPEYAIPRAIVFCQDNVQCGALFSAKKRSYGLYAYQSPYQGPSD